jgi:hypothetical protein
MEYAWDMNGNQMGIQWEREREIYIWNVNEL